MEVSLFLYAARIGQNRCRFFFEHDHIDVIDWIDDSYRRVRSELFAQTIRVEIQLCSGMQRPDNRLVGRRYFGQGMNDLRQSILVVRILGAMYRAEVERTTVQSQCRHDRRLFFSYLAEGQGGIVHHVAGMKDIARDTFVAKVTDGGVCRAEQMAGDMVGQHAVDFFGHLPVEAAQPGLHMCDRDMQLCSCQRAG